MHHCLLLPEIVQHILDELDYAVIGPDRDKQLLALAQIQIFHQPALAKIWASIPNVGPIIRCASPNIWKVVGDDFEEELHLNRPIYPSDIAKMKEYARLVQQYGINIELFFIPVAPEVWSSLRRALGNTILFPNLQHIHIADTPTLESITLFSARNLTSLAINLADRGWPYQAKLSATQLAMLVTFSAQCTGLESVCLRSLKQPEEQQAIITALSHWPHLSRYVSFNASFEIIRALSRCSNSLRHLEFDEFIPPESLGPPIRTDTADFPVLECMKIGFPKMLETIRFMDFFTPLNSLRKLTIEIRNAQPCPEDLWLSLLRTITLKHSRSLRELEIQEGLRRGGDHNVLPLSNAFISELALNFTALTCINIANSEGFNIVDEDLRLMTEALPLLEKFFLIDYMILYTSNAVTVASLVYFARNCSRLTSLALAFDAGSNKIPPRQSESLPIQGPRLERLHVSLSRIDDPQRVASFLFDVFSSIKLLDSRTGTDDTSQRYGRLWSEVWNLLTARMEGVLVDS